MDTYCAEDWLRFLGIPAEHVTVIESDVSTVLAQSDKALLIQGSDPYLNHIEVQSGYEPGIDWRLLKYNVLHEDQNSLPVWSVLVLLRPEADSPELTGELVRIVPRRKPHHYFYYQVFRVWLEDADRILKGGLGTVPLATIANVSEERLLEIISQMEKRIEEEASPGEAAELLSETLLLLGLRMPHTQALGLLKGARGMKESSTYQAILEEGREEGREQGERNILLSMGQKRLGEPSQSIKEAIERIKDTDRIKKLCYRVFEVESWAVLGLSA